MSPLTSCTPPQLDLGPQVITEAATVGVVGEVALFPSYPLCSWSQRRKILDSSEAPTAGGQQALRRACGISGAKFPSFRVEQCFVGVGSLGSIRQPSLGGGECLGPASWQLCDPGQSPNLSDSQPSDLADGSNCRSCPEYL